jgi:hypothetical protein
MADPIQYPRQELGQNGGTAGRRVEGHLSARDVVAILTVTPPR